MELNNVASNIVDGYKLSSWRLDMFYTYNDYTTKT